MTKSVGEKSSLHCHISSGIDIFSNDYIFANLVVISFDHYSYA